MSRLFAAITTRVLPSFCIRSRVRDDRGGFPQWKNLLGALLVAALTIGNGPPALAGESATESVTNSRRASLARSDESALARLVGEQVLKQNACQVSLRAREVEPEERYAQLLAWVLPADRDVIRVEGGFLRPKTNRGQAEIAVDDLRSLDESPESTWLCWPAKELVIVADELGRLDALQSRIDSVVGTEDQIEDSRDALLSLIDIARGEKGALRQRVEARFAWQRTSDKLRLRPQQRWADLLVLWSASDSEATSSLVTEDLFGAYQSLSQYEEDLEADLLNDYLRLLRGRAGDLALAQRSANKTGAEEAVPLEWFSRVDASTHGNARPLTRFRVSGETASKVSGHELDYLMYRWPVVGDFEATSLAATQPGSFSEMMVHGVGVQPVEAGKAFTIGGHAKGNQRFDLVPPLEEIESESHLRAVIQDGELVHTFNGRQINSASVPETAAPWVSIRSWRGTRSDLRAFQLSGSASVPNSIDLLDSSLRGWTSYYDPDMNDGLGTWGVEPSESDTVLRSARNENQIPAHEDLLRYIRPISWNAVLEYEFWHSGVERANVHPAFGRRAFLLTSEGVLIHRLTDGRYERSGLRPDGVEPSDSQSSVKLRFVDGWNRMRLEVRDAELSLWLNGELVGRFKILKGDSRFFGFFRYRGDADAVIRRASLRGAWPKSLPHGQGGLLADSSVLELDKTAGELAVQFTHDFREGAPPTLFDFDGDDTSVIDLPEGIRMTRSHGEGVRAMRVCAIIDGDFDIVAGYRDLEIADGPPTWHCGFGLLFSLGNATRDQCAIHRRRDRMHGHHYVGFGQKETNAGGKTTWIGGANVVDESTSGRLRLARRGRKVYALHAVDDSAVFRLVKVTEVPEGQIEIHGLRLIADVGKGLHASVTWTDLQIRAEEVDFLNAKDEPRALANLDERKKQLPSEILDLQELTLPQAGIAYRTMEEAEVTSDGDGALATVVAGSSSARFTMYKGVSLGTEFDVEVDFDVLQLDRGLREAASSEVVLQVALQDASDLPLDDQATMIREATLILRHKWNGYLDLRPRVVGRGRGGKTIYLPIRTIPVEMVDQMRIAQHDQVLYFMYSDQNSDEMKVIATYPLDRALRAVAVNTWMIASPEKRVVKVRWKALKIFGSTPLNDALRREPF